MKFLYQGHCDHNSRYFGHLSKVLGKPQEVMHEPLVKHVQIFNWLYNQFLGGQSVGKFSLGTETNMSMFCTWCKGVIRTLENFASVICRRMFVKGFEKF